MTFQFVATLPPWMTFITGEVPIVLIAPHGGRRPADAPIQDNVKVNDLYTAELASELAIRTRGYALINHTLDRNALDLNRISQVRGQAPWFLAALVELLSNLVTRHGHVRVFFVHGWNVVQPVCDLGMGLKRQGGHLVVAGKASPTLDLPFFTEVVLPFRVAALEQGIDVALGRRYPAADKNNMMQVFSPRFFEDESPAIRTLASLASRGVVNTVQLELGVGLRWPGAERDRFVEVFCRTLGNHLRDGVLPANGKRDFSTVAFPSHAQAARAVEAEPFLPQYRGKPPMRLALHFHDPQSGLGVMGGIEFDRSMPTHSGRLLLSLGGTEMILFTGEDEATADPEHIQVGGFVWQRRPNGLSITYQGTVMRFSHPQAFIRLEDGLAASWIEPAEVSLQLRFLQTYEKFFFPILFSQLQGEICLRDRRCLIEAWGFADILQPEETGRLSPRRLLSLPFGEDLGIFLSWAETSDGERSSGVIYHHGTPYPLQLEDWTLDYTFQHGRPTNYQLAVTPTTPFAVQCGGETLTAIPIVRHAARGSALAVTFGLSRSRWQGREAYGIYEFSERLRDASARK